MIVGSGGDPRPATKPSSTHLNPAPVQFHLLIGYQKRWASDPLARGGLLVGIHGELKVNLFHNTRII